MSTRNDQTGPSDLSAVERDDIRPARKSISGEVDTLTSDTARQGPRGARVLIILIASLVMLAIAWAVIELFFSKSL